MSDEFDPRPGPVRTRGAIRAPSDDIDAQASPVRTRGAIRPRGASAPDQRAAVTRDLSLGDLVMELRRAQGGSAWRPAEAERLPLTLVLHGYGHPIVREFLDALDPYLRRSDALWFVPATRDSGVTPRSDRGVVLNLDEDTDDSIYRNMNADLVFYTQTAVDDHFAAREQRFWMNRARSMILHDEDASLHVGLRDARARLVDCYRWSGGETLQRA
jgi:hypothetical protein